MCAALELNSRMLRPGRWVSFWSGAGRRQLVWAGFAREESLPWWRKKGGELVDIPADRFAERNDATGRLGWDDVPPGKVVRGLVDPNGEAPLLKVVTRASTVEEAGKFGHDRMPVIEKALFNAERIEQTEVVERSGQRELML